MLRCVTDETTNADTPKEFSPVVVQPAEPAEAFPGMPAAPAPPPTAGDLVRAWCEAWSSAHGGRAPDPTLVRRVAGICRAIAKDRTDLDSWRDAWRAARRAGASGRYDVVAELAEVVVTPTGRANHYLALARDAAPSMLQLEG